CVVAAGTECSRCARDPVNWTVRRTSSPRPVGRRFASRFLAASLDQPVARCADNLHQQFGRGTSTSVITEVPKMSNLLELSRSVVARGGRMTDAQLGLLLAELRLDAEFLVGRDCIAVS